MFTDGIVKPAQVMDCVELVVEDDHLVEQKRLPGENSVSKIFNCKFLLILNYFVCVSSWLDVVKIIS